MCVRGVLKLIVGMKSVCHTSTKSLLFVCVKLRLSLNKVNWRVLICWLCTSEVKCGSVYHSALNHKCTNSWQKSWYFVIRYQRLNMFLWCYTHSHFRSKVCVYLFTLSWKVYFHISWYKTWHTQHLYAYRLFMCEAKRWDLWLWRVPWCWRCIHFK